ncbi:MAG TPA: ribonuclease E/G, partial [Anaeromyxobacter sp.]|nr:ribonuclease E/G [Anaeromyxobacter sp.]
MASGGGSILVINAAGAETRVALVENGTIHEYYLERKREKGIVGNIYKGRVVRVLPGMQAAFVDIGLDKAAFLYVGDVYGDPDFSEEFELTEGEHRGEVTEVPTEEEADEAEARAQAAATAPPPPAAEAVVEVAPQGDVTAPEASHGAPVGAGAPAGAPEGVAEAAADAPPPEPVVATEHTPEDAPPAPLTALPLANEVGGLGPVPAIPDLLVPPLADAPLADALAPAAPEPASPTAEVPPAPAAAEPPSADRLQVREKEAAREAKGGPEPRADRERGDRERRRDRDDRGRRDGREARDGRERGRNGREEKRKEPKNIQDLLKEGQEVIVQVAKDPIGTKGARITSHISLPGRHLVFMPTVDHIGISRRIEKDGERRRLREIVDRMRPDGTGFIVRTVAENVEAGKLEADIRFLIQVWNEIIRAKDKVSAPALLHPDLDLILRATRDLFTADVQKLVIDDRDEYERILRFVHEQAPHLESQIEFYRGDEPIFDAYGIEQELKRAAQRKVWLKSGGYLIMDQAEALTAIDVNSGRYVGKKNLEETITKINVEA